MEHISGVWIPIGIGAMYFVAGLKFALLSRS